MGTRVVEVGDAQSSRSIPTTGMRGGLGRTLLTAFLILTIVPLALIGGYAAQNNRRNLQQEVQSKLQAVATLKGEELRQYFESLQRLPFPQSFSTTAFDSWWHRVRVEEADLVGVFLENSTGRELWTVGECDAASVIGSAVAGDTQSTVLASSASRALSSSRHAMVFPLDSGDWLFVIQSSSQRFGYCLSSTVMDRLLQYDVLLDAALMGKTGQVYLLSTFQSLPDDDGGASDSAGLHPELSQDGVYVNHQGIPVIGAQYALDDYGVAIVVEQARAETLASTDRVAATLIALVLAVALATTTIAAVVIRQITRPVIQLTESAVAMAEGDLDQHLAVTSRDEIGILTYVFNEMAADLKSLYEDLEAKVTERTQRLQQANYQIQRRALHLQASQEVGQAITSVRDPFLLLNRVVDLIRDRFVYASVAVYIVEPGGGEIRLRALSPSDNGMPDTGTTVSGWPVRLYAGDGSIVERAIRKRKPQVDHQQTDEVVEWYRRTLSRVVIPLRVGGEVLGALAVLSIEREGIQSDELEVLELLAAQVAIALENAKAYERERVSAQRLEEAEVFKARFLANMSHELREPLNTIIGFSRLMIKGIDGDMTLQQLQDLERIYDDGQRLLFLVNDILLISQIQAGIMELKLQPVNLRDVIAGVMPTASALIRGEDIELVQDIPDDLPIVQADPIRLRLVLVHLFNNAAKFTNSGYITIKAWSDEDQVYVSVIDTGVGIPAEDRERIFNHFDKGKEREGRWQEGIGLGLALSKEFIEMHGGQMWVNSEVNKGSTFTFSLPCVPVVEGESGL